MPNRRRAAWALVLAVVYAAAAAAALREAYRFDEPRRWRDPTSGLEARLLATAERWRPVDRRHPLDVAPGVPVLALEPAGGLAHLAVHTLGCGPGFDPVAAIAVVDARRRPGHRVYATFWSAPPGQAWRREQSFADRPGLKTVKRVAPGPGGRTYLVFDYVLLDGRGCGWYVGAFVVERVFPYYEVDLKFHLAALRLPGAEGAGP